MQLDSSYGRPTTSRNDDDALAAIGVASLPHPADTYAAQDVDQSALARGRSEAAMRTMHESEALFRTTFERAVVGIAHTALDGRWLRVNQRLCDLLGYTLDELMERTFQDVTYPDDLDVSLAIRRRLVAGDQDAAEWDKRYVRKDGTIIWAHLTVSLVRTPEGKPDYFITMLQDITERKRLEEDRALLLQWEQAARRDLEATNAQLQALQALTDTALSHLALDDLLGELLDRVTGVMDVDNVTILLCEEDDQTLIPRAARGRLEQDVGRGPVAVGQGLLGRIAASREPLIVDTPSASDFDGAPPQLREHLRSVAGVPLQVQDPVDSHLVSRLVGVLVVGSVTPRHFSEADVQLLQHTADRTAVAIDRARLYTAEQEARQRAEAALARAQASEAQAAARAEQLHTILETIADGVAVLDAEGHIQVVNRAYRELHALEGGPAGFEALPLGERVDLLEGRDPTTDAPLSYGAWPAARALRGEMVAGPGADVRMRTFSGRELELNATAAPLREPDGRVAGAVLVLRDLTERNHLAREREQARADELAARETSRRLEEFVASAAHDLRAPVTAVVGYLDLAQHQAERLAVQVQQAHPELAPRVDAVRQRLGEASQGADRLTRLLTLLFDTAAFRAGKLQLHRVPCDLVTLVREQVEALSVAAPDRTIRLHLPRDGAPIPVEVDADRIGQVVDNYVTNALKYSPPDQPVEVRVTTRKESRAGQTRMARITVRDHGPGLPKEERARVWEPFHRAPGVTVQGGSPAGIHGSSLGLGLSISEAIITAHGGRVGVASAVGQGSSFWFTLHLEAPNPIQSGKAV